MVVVGGAAAGEVWVVVSGANGMVVSTPSPVISSASMATSCGQLNDEACVRRGHDSSASRRWLRPWADSRSGPRSRQRQRRWQPLYRSCLARSQGSPADGHACGSVQTPLPVARFATRRGKSCRRVQGPPRGGHWVRPIDLSTGGAADHGEDRQDQRQEHGAERHAPARARHRMIPRTLALGRNAVANRPPLNTEKQSP